MRKCLACLLICLLLCGCSMDVESYLKPPRVQGQQYALQTALETAIFSGIDVTSQYILKYPTGGTLPNAYILLDADGHITTADNAETTVILYAFDTVQNVHLHLLHRTADGWQSVADTIGESTDVERVMLGDINGDGRPELLVGWNLLSSEYALSAYLLTESLDGIAKTVGHYRDCAVGDLNADGCEEVILLNDHTDGNATASVYTWNAGDMRESGTVFLHKQIRTFSKCLFGKLPDGNEGLYLDAVLENGSYITEIVYWDGNRYVAPLHNGDISTRAAMVAVTDADGNGVPEIPITSRLQAYPTAAANDTWQWLTEWYSFDVSSQKIVRQFASIVNRQDGYFIELEDRWVPLVSTRYDKQRAVLWLDMADENGTVAPMLAVQATDSTAAEDTVDGLLFHTVADGSDLRIWYDENNPYHLTAEKISYMLMKLS